MRKGGDLLSFFYVAAEVGAGVEGDLVEVGFAVLRFQLAEVGVLP
jgi:hypothetical protein